MRTATANDGFTCCLPSPYLWNGLPQLESVSTFEDHRCLGMRACYLRDRQPLVNCGAAPH